MIYYLWDAGVVVGYCFWPGEKLRNYSKTVEPYGEHCDYFVTQKATTCQHRIPTSCHGEAKGVIFGKCDALRYVIDLFAGRTPSAPGMIDYNRVMDTYNAIKGKAPDHDAVIALTKILSLVNARYLQAYRLCSLKTYSASTRMAEAELLKSHLLKRGDVEAYTTAMHFHQRQECVFITTDHNDFGTLDCEKLGIACKVPRIEFIRDFVPPTPSAAVLSSPQ